MKSPQKHMKLKLTALLFTFAHSAFATTVAVYTGNASFNANGWNPQNDYVNSTYTGSGASGSFGDYQGFPHTGTHVNDASADTVNDALGNGVWRAEFIDNAGVGGIGSGTPWYTQRDAGSAGFNTQADYGIVGDFADDWPSFVPDAFVNDDDGGHSAITTHRVATATDPGYGLYHELESSGAANDLPLLRWINPITDSDIEIVNFAGLNRFAAGISEGSHTVEGVVVHYDVSADTYNILYSRTETFDADFQGSSGNYPLSGNPVNENFSGINGTIVAPGDELIFTLRSDINAIGDIERFSWHTDGISFSFAPVPEPSSLLLSAIGVMLGLSVRRRK